MGKLVLEFRSYGLVCLLGPSGPNDHDVIVEIDNPNSLQVFNRFEEEGHGERRYNHFRLIDLTQEELYAMEVPAILDDEEE